MWMADRGQTVDELSEGRWVMVGVWVRGAPAAGGRTSPGDVIILSGSNCEMALAMPAYCSCAGLAFSRHR